MDLRSAFPPDDLRWLVDHAAQSDPDCAERLEAIVRRRGPAEPARPG